MQPIHNTIQDFTNALKNPCGVVCDVNGTWRQEGLFWRMVRWIFPSVNDKFLLTIAAVFNRSLEQLERTGRPTFDVDTPAELMNALQGSKNCQVQKELSRLRWRQVSVDCRPREMPPLEHRFIDHEKLSQLEEAARKWKKSIELYEGRPLSHEETEKLRAAASWPQFNELIIEDKILQNRFFKWALRDDNDVDIFVRFPAVVERLTNCHLSSRIGRFARQHLLQFNILECRADVTLRFEGIAVSLLNEGTQVSFMNGTVLKTVGEALKVFADKNKRVGDLEVFGHGQMGIRLWNPHEWMKEVDFTQGKWWEGLHIFEELSTDEVERRHGVRLKADEWLFLGSATSQTMIPDVDNSHGFEHVIAPVGDAYRLLPIGKLAKRFPQGGCDHAKFIADTVEGVKAFPDENAFYSHRQLAMHPVVFTADEGKRLMDYEKKKAQEPQIFQFGAENCAYEPQHTLENVKGKENVPQLYLQPVLESVPTNRPLNVIFKIIRSLPKSWHVWGLGLLATSLGGKRGKDVTVDGEPKFKSVATSSFMEHGMIYQPGHLHQQIRDEANPINGVITYGHLELRERTLKPRERI